MLTSPNPTASLFGGDRVPIVFVSASSIDAWSFRQIADRKGRLIVNVPDISGALLTIERLRPAAVVCDTEVDGVGSWHDLLQSCRAQSGVPLIVLSRHASADLRAEAHAHGAAGVLSKPFVPQEVERALAAALAPATRISEIRD